MDFSGSQNQSDTFLRPCACLPEDEEKSFCYVESSALDKSASGNESELSENVWFGLKPPRIAYANTPLVSARQIQIARAQLVGQGKEPEEQRRMKKAKPASPSLPKKKSAVRFLSRTDLEDRDYD